MSKSSKLLGRLLSKPKDLTWDELIKILASFGYEEIKKGKTGGSRRRFVDHNNNVIMLHKPHPLNIVKPYVIKQVIEHLQERGQIENE
ncbi:MAG: hypothetical protein JWQ96_1818 [Segetibacter sp.]|nr:hypothetical protein [Segetibacter sp.]